MDDVFYLYERNKYIYINCKLLQKKCFGILYDGECYCHMDDIVKPLTIGDQSVKCKLKVKCYIKFGEECPICLENIIHKKNAYLTGCGHAYHRLCLFKVFETKWKNKPYSTLRCSLCRCALGFPELFERYAFGDNGLDNLENFWLVKDYIIGNFCGASKHYIGMNKNCNRCLIYRNTGEC